MSFLTENIPMFTVALGALIALTNIIVEVIKGLFPEKKIHTNIIAVATAIVLTVVAGIAYANKSGIAMLWYDYIAIVIFGVLVAYGAMFGYDKLKEILEQFKK